MPGVRQVFPHVVRRWSSLAMMVSLFSLVIYLVAQQVYRQGADDPQVQNALDVVNKLDQGTSPNDLVSTELIDVTKSLSPFITIVDVSGKVQASSMAPISRTVRVPPHGTIDFALEHGENRVTWQPVQGLRLATVIMPTATNTRYVIAGRSLQDVERRIKNLGYLVFLGWIVGMGTTFIVVLYTEDKH